MAQQSEKRREERKKQKMESTENVLQGELETISLFLDVIYLFII